MDSAGDPKPKPLSFPNGLKKHQQQPPPHPLLRPSPIHAAAPPLPAPPSPVTVDCYLYRECLKNHAASLGGHALDGCGEFMPSAASNLADPASLKCAACGCHRNFHRRVPADIPALQYHLRRTDEVREAAAEMAAADVDEDEDDNNDNAHEEDDDEEEEDDDEEDDNEIPVGGFGFAPPQSAPHMLLALSTGGAAPARQQPPPEQLNLSPAMAGSGSGTSAAATRKRFRTKFSPEQKQRMQELSERLGWRLQKRDEALVDEWCREIGVGKGVFKVWMHNNKHTFLGTGRRGSTAGAPAPPSQAYLAAAAAAAAAQPRSPPGMDQHQHQHQHQQHQHLQQQQQQSTPSSMAAGLSIRHAMNGASPPS